MKFSMTEGDIFNIWNWKEAHSERPRCMRNHDFPATMVIHIDGNELQLRFPKHPEHNNRLGALTSAFSNSTIPDKNWTEIGYIKFDLLYNVAKVAQ